MVYFLVIHIYSHKYNLYAALQRSQKQSAHLKIEHQNFHPQACTFQLTADVNAKEKQGYATGSDKSISIASLTCK